MLRDITLGQYFPGESVIHKLDPRTKIILTLVYITLIFIIKNFTGYIILGIFTFIIVDIASIPFKYLFKGIKPLLYIIIITGLINIFMTSGKTLFTIGPLIVTYEGVWIAVLMSFRLFFLVLGASLLTYTTSPIMLTDGIESLLKPLQKIGVPAHELAMMMTIALRFIPTLLEETDKIMKAQMARGADFESGNLVRRAKNMVPLLVPLFISAFRRADELAVAMEARCYRGGYNRTKLKQLKFTFKDFVATLIVLGLMIVLIWSRKLYY